MRAANPYNYNLPVGPEMFFGRQEDVETLTHHLTAAPGDSFALIGGRRMGKTSLLEALLRALEPLVKDPARGLLPLPVFLDLSGEGMDSVNAFFHTVGERAQDALNELPALLPTDALAVGENQPPAPAFGRMLRSWGRTVMEQRGFRLRLILLLDECEQIVEQPWTPELYGALRSLLVGRTTRSLLKVVMTGSHRFLTQVRERGSPLRNVLKYHMLRVLDGEATHSLITQPTEGVLPNEAVQAVAGQSGGHPFLTQYLMHHLWERGLENATPEAVQRIVADFPHERNDFRDWLNGLGDSGKRVYRMLAQAGEALTESQIRTTLRPTPPDLLQVLDALCYHGLVVQEVDGGSYRVTGQMFREWFTENMAECPDRSEATRSLEQAINVFVAESGAVVIGDVAVEGGDFVGRDAVASADPGATARPALQATTHVLPFDRLSPAAFERLCLWLVEREGYTKGEHLGLAGGEQGRDVVAYKPTPQGEELWYFQCKRYRSINAKTLTDEVDKYLQLTQKKPHLRPAGVVFVISCAVSAKVREEVGAYCEQHSLAYEFWALTELDMRVKRHSDLLWEFFNLGSPSDRLLTSNQGK